MATKTKKFRARVEDKMFLGMSHGLKFSGGISEEFDNQELYDRLLAKGYEPYKNTKDKKASQ